ncbi:ABC transporter ATP-binding protein [Pengzhenrongella sicca]|uniref:ATP-binding cassette domain-containing protein n=1 Tax=Pengzhenrongella sicca TaxID=2819238 RepID=A0A8A4ZE62_9MICO|nr:ATP-binding cassette domain-containing protein [Pengzhenrongella sicca]QTE29309.1 ATP-binding cassette domain-containing protein [Pengzhenrongella sicca]
MSVLEIDHLFKAYGSVRALQDMTFEVRAGEIFGFVGSNGAGKTTTMRIMLGVLAADSGSVRWDGAELDLDSRRRVGYMPEERGLYPKMKVGEQLRFLAGLHGMSPADATGAVERWTDRLGVGDRRGDNVEKLSLGNQQRVQLAAALVHNPDVLVLDEPFSGLDPVAVDIMSAVLRERADAGVPVIFSSHQLDLVERLCDRVGIVQSGRMQAMGTIDELRTTDRPQWLLEVGAEPLAVVAAARALPGVLAHVAPGRTDAVVVELSATAAPGAEQDVLRAALAHGPVRGFSPIRPSLTDLFRDVVSADADADAAAAAGGADPARTEPDRAGALA